MSRWVYPDPDAFEKAAQRAVKKAQRVREQQVKRWLAKFDKEDRFHSLNWTKESEFEAEVWSTIGQWDEETVPELAWKAASYDEFHASVLERAYVCVRSSMEQEERETRGK